MPQIQKVDGYRTPDGKFFETAHEAEAHLLFQILHSHLVAMQGKAPAEIANYLLSRTDLYISLIEPPPF